MGGMHAGGQRPNGWTELLTHQIAVAAARLGAC